MENENKIREGQITPRNPNEVNSAEPAKELKAQHKTDIKESDLGREQSQTPADEHIEHRLSQIDDETVKLRQSDLEKKDSKDSDEGK